MRRTFAAAFCVVLGLWPATIFWSAPARADPAYKVADDSGSLSGAKGQDRRICYGTKADCQNPSSSAGSSAKRVVLVIGNTTYKHTPALVNPGNDATDVAEALGAIGFDVTLKIDVEKRQMDQVFAQFARAAKSADAALVYYAGHGMQYHGRILSCPSMLNCKMK